jgi:hypothetical protein
MAIIEKKKSQIWLHTRNESRIKIKEKEKSIYILGYLLELYR